MKEVLKVLLLLCLFDTGVSLRAQFFSEIGAALTGVGNGSVAWGDFDNDGDRDLLVAGETGSGPITRLYRNNGAGAFTDLGTVLPGISFGAAAWGDYNGDGFLDLALTGNSSAGPVSRIYRNGGDATFTDINPGLPSLTASSLAWADYDNDGDLDLFLTGHTGATNYARILRNHGNDTFAEGPALPGATNAAVAWCDFDRDNDLDLLLAGATSDTPASQSSRLFRNQNGTFTNITGIVLTPISRGAAGWGDYDNDGDPDLLLAGSSISGGQSVPTLQLYRNDGGELASIPTLTFGVQNCSLAWGDLDNDGDLDAVVAGQNSNFQPSTSVYLGNGGGIFTEIFTGLPGVSNASLALGDYDNDGDLDLVLAGSTALTNITRIFRNNTPFPNPTPLPPFNLSSLVNGKTVILSWTAGADANQFGGYTYNLRIGSSPGSENIVAAMANPGTGSRRVPQIGNVNQQLGWKLRLPVGTYYWSAQTIDHGLSGSEFELEQSFEIPPQAPDVTTLAPTNVSATSATLRLSANPNGAATLVYFQYGLTTNFGVETMPLPIGSGSVEGTAGSSLTDLEAQTTYHFRAVASNQFGFSFGNNASFTTTSMPTPLRLASPGWSGSQFQFQLIGQPGQMYQIQISSNLLSWTPATNVILTTSPMPFADSTALGIPRRFYRAVLRME